jgi:hypothetical protein
MMAQFTAHFAKFNARKEFACVLILCSAIWDIEYLCNFLSPAVTFLALLPVVKILGFVMEDVSKRFRSQTHAIFVRCMVGNLIELIAGVSSQIIH